MSWVPLKDLKESHPLEVAEYAKGNGISSKPSFAWWVHRALRQGRRIISKVKSKYWQTMHKFGICMPKTIEEAIRFNEEDGTTFWLDAIEKEMRNVWVAFEFNEEDQVPIGHKEIKCHWVFDIKMSTLTRKARLIANGSKTEPPKCQTYASVVLRDLVWIFSLLAALNDVNILSCNIQNTYLTAETSKKLYTYVDAVFGLDKGRPAKIVRALYGLKSSRAGF